MFNLTNKIALITGGGSGIGKSIATLFASQGATVIIVDINEIGASEVVDEINSDKDRAYFYKCNITSQQEVREVVQRINSQFMSIDILVNNAGISHIGNAENTSEEDLDRLLSVNVKGAYNFLHTVLPTMKLKGGVVLNLASVAASVGLADRFAYSITKGAIIAMTLSVAKDFLPYNIRCNSISPGRVHTPFVDGFLQKNYPGQEQEMFLKLSKTQPIGRMGTPQEIAALALYLCSEEASFITGKDYLIDGGLTTLNT